MLSGKVWAKNSKQIQNKSEAQKVRTDSTSPICWQISWEVWIMRSVGGHILSVISGQLCYLMLLEQGQANRQ